ncbi:hypothetical protein L0156_22985 [bacterium]|nr:hypothetical protein [bacterium]
MYLLNPLISQKTLRNEIALSDTAGIQLPFAPVIAPNSKSYNDNYEYERNLSEFYVVDGPKGRSGNGNFTIESAFRFSATDSFRISTGSFTLIVETVTLNFSAS